MAKQGNPSTTRWERLRTPYMALGTMVCVCLLFASVVEAKKKTLTFKHKIALVTPIASNAWPNSPCKSKEQVRYDPPLVAQYYAKNSGVAAIAFYYDGTCRVIFNSLGARSSLKTICWMLTHEFGHLAGLDHINQDVSRLINFTDPMRTMGPFGNNWAGCNKIKTPKGYVDPYSYF